MFDEKLNQYRKELNGIDDQIVQLLNDRYRICTQIGEYKKAHNMEVLDASREQAVIDRVSAFEDYPGMVAAVWPKIMEFSRLLQN